MAIQVQKSDPPESTAIMAESVVKISDAMSKLMSEPGGLTQDAIVILLHDMTKVGKRDIHEVLQGLKQLKSWYCRK